MAFNVARAIQFVNRLGTKLVLAALIFQLLLVLNLTLVIYFDLRYTQYRTEQRSAEALEAQARAMVLGLTMERAQRANFLLARPGQICAVVGSYLSNSKHAGNDGHWNTTFLSRLPDGQWMDINPARKTNVFIPKSGALDQQTISFLDDTSVLNHLADILIEQYPDVVGIHITSPSGVARYVAQITMLEKIPADYQPNNQQFWQNAAPPNNKERKIKWTQPYRIQASPDLLITASMPIYEGDQFWGVVGVDLSINSFMQLLGQTQVSSTTGTFMVDQRGEYLITSSRSVMELMGLPATGALPPKLSVVEVKELFGQDPVLDRIISAMTSQKTDVRLFGLVGQPVLVAYAPLESVGWSLGNIVRLNDITGPAASVTTNIRSDINQTLRNTLIVIIIFLILSTGGMFYTAWRLTRPIATLVNGTRAVASGKLNVTIPVTSRDELGLLASSFNKMTIELKLAYRRLEEQNVALQTEISEKKRAEDALRTERSLLAQRIQERTKKNVFDNHWFFAAVEDMFRQRADARDIKLLFEIDPRVPKYFYCEETKLRQMVITLLCHALECTEEGEVKLRVGYSRNPIDLLIFEVEYTGNTAITRQFLQLMGDDLHMKVIEERGNLLWFELPIKLHESGSIPL